MSEPMSTPRRSSYSAINTAADTLALVDQCRAALSQTSGKLSRAALVTAAVEHYAATLADEGHPIDAVDGDQLTDLARSKNITLTQLSLAWLLAQKDYIVPIPGSKNSNRVAQNLAAAHLDLTASDLALITELVPAGPLRPRPTY